MAKRRRRSRKRKRKGKRRRKRKKKKNEEERQAPVTNKAWEGETGQATSILQLQSPVDEEGGWTGDEGEGFRREMGRTLSGKSLVVVWSVQV